MIHNKRTLLLITFFFVFTCLYSQSKAYIIYNNKGNKVSYKKMVKQLSKKNIVLFGELHNNPISHWLEYELTSSLHQSNKLILGAEMIESDNQEALNLYLKDSIDAKALDSTARLWKNYKTDYAPLIDFAKNNKLPFIATNIPRRHASLVYKNGFEALDSLNDKEKEWIAPLPIAFDPDLTSYKNILQMMGNHGTPQLVMAQAIKDATMAHFILRNYITGSTFIHYNGAYHSNHYEGVLWYLKKERIDLNYATISTVSQKNVTQLLNENKNIADFIICVSSNMTTTY